MDFSQLYKRVLKSWGTIGLWLGIDCYKVGYNFNENVGLQCYSWENTRFEEEHLKGIKAHRRDKNWLVMLLSFRKK